MFALNETASLLVSCKAAHPYTHTHLQAQNHPSEPSHPAVSSVATRLAAHVQSHLERKRRALLLTLNGQVCVALVLSLLVRALVRAKPFLQLPHSQKVCLSLVAARLWR